MIVTRSRTSFTSSWLHNRHATHVACIRRHTYACIPPSEPRPLQPDAPREPLRPDVSQQSKPKAKTKPFTFTASHSQPDLSRRPNPDRGHSQPLERARSRRKPDLIPIAAIHSHSSEHAAAAARPLRGPHSWCVWVLPPATAHGQRRGRLTATPAHETGGGARPPPHRRRRRPPLTSPDADTRRDRGTPEKRQGSKVPGRAPPHSPPRKVVEGLEGRPRFLTDGARLA